jgi:hypothetical protein
VLRFIVIIMSDFMLNAVMLSVVMMSVAAPKYFQESLLWFTNKKFYSRGPCGPLCPNVYIVFYTNCSLFIPKTPVIKLYWLFYHLWLDWTTIGSSLHFRLNLVHSIHRHIRPNFSSSGYLRIGNDIYVFKSYITTIYLRMFI